MAKKENLPHLAIFETFKTKTGELTGEATRQRKIIEILSKQQNPKLRTRTSIAHQIAEDNNTAWQNLYSAIFKDIDEVLLPLGILEEEGRLPLKRGPKALQEQGMPFYKLTRLGMLVGWAIDSHGSGYVVREALENPETELFDSEIRKAFTSLSKNLPWLFSSILEEYLRGYVNGKITNIIPVNAEKLKKTLTGGTAISYLEMLSKYHKLTPPEKKILDNAFDKLLS